MPDFPGFSAYTGFVILRQGNYNKAIRSNKVKVKLTPIKVNERRMEHV